MSTPESQPWNRTLNHALWRATQAISRNLNGALEQLGVTITQLGMMVTLEQRGPCSAADLARGHHITPQSVNTALNHLDQLAWITRSPHPVNKRIVLIDVTDRGRDGIAEGKRLVASVTAPATEALGGAEAVDRLTWSLDQITEALNLEWDRSVPRT
ncbi:MarR family transcriptional regulator [Streptomyces sp. NPDC047043]|uniref:MarR family winged helix-turn-helix transcriptional regulator n=1 Tax=Streptomyces sp. NPDC047043 TaxID=3154497 RepID=UPI0033F2DD68